MNVENMHGEKTKNLRLCYSLNVSDQFLSHCYIGFVCDRETSTMRWTRTVFGCCFRESKFLRKYNTYRAARPHTRSSYVWGTNKKTVNV